jgi:hypothetical protein
VRHSKGVGCYKAKGIVVSGDSNDLYSVELKAAEEYREAENAAPKLTLENANEWSFPTAAVIGGERFNEKDLEDLYGEIKRHYTLGARGEIETAKEIKGKVMSIPSDNLILVHPSDEEEPVVLEDRNTEEITDGDKIQRLVLPSGRYQYVTVMGAVKTIKKYQSVMPVSYGEFRYFLSSDGASAFPEVARAIKKKQADRDLKSYIAESESKARAEDEADRKREAQRRNREFFRMKGPQDFR